MFFSNWFDKTALKRNQKIEDCQISLLLRHPELVSGSKKLTGAVTAALAGILKAGFLIYA
jgi:hypothetical protein